MRCAEFATFPLHGMLYLGCATLIPVIPHLRKRFSAASQGEEERAPSKRRPHVPPESAAIVDLENGSYVIGDSSRRLSTESASRLIRQRGLDLRILMARAPGPSCHPLAPDRLWMDFRISWEPALVNIRCGEYSLRILRSIESAGDDGGSWARPRSPPPCRPEVLRSGGIA